MNIVPLSPLGVSNLFLLCSKRVHFNASSISRSQHRISDIFLSKLSTARIAIRNCHSMASKLICNFVQIERVRDIFVFQLQHTRGMSRMRLERRLGNQNPALWPGQREKKSRSRLVQKVPLAALHKDFHLLLL